MRGPSQTGERGAGGRGVQQVGITMGIPIMSAVVTARLGVLGDQSAHAVLSGVGLALIVNAAACLAAAVLIAVFLRTSGRKQVAA